jgi:CHASE2 domain-containing sensor protein
VGAVLAWQWPHPLVFLLVEGFIFVGVVGITAGFYLQAIWITLFVPALGLVFISFAVMAYTTYQPQKQNQTILQQNHTILLKLEQQ